MHRERTGQRRIPRSVRPLLLLALVLLVGGIIIHTWLPSTAAQTTSRNTVHHEPPQKTKIAGSGTTTLSSTDSNMARTLHQEYWGADAWIWRTRLPYNRLVLFYGNPYSAPMGPIGQYSDDELMAKLSEQAQAYEALDPSHPVVPGLDYVTPVVQSQPMADGTWVARMPDDSIQHYITLANSNHALFFFDLQVGHSTVQREVENLWPYLQQPGVDLSLDPEFDLSPGEIPDVEFGHMKASEVNWAIDQLSRLVQQQHLPPKILIVHRFLEEMLPDWQHIKPQPGVQVVITVDGFGSPGSKLDDYRLYDQQELLPFEYPGMKLFYRLDKPLMSPAELLALKPAPLMVMYQ